MAKEFIVITRQTGILSLDFINRFATFKEAQEFTEKQTAELVIYESVAKTTIKHETKKFDENTNDFTRKQIKVS